MLVVVADDAEIHAVNGDGLSFDLHFAIALARPKLGTGSFDRFERTLEIGDDFGFGGECSFEVTVFHIGGHLRASDAEEVEVGLGDVYQNLADGPDSRGGSPGVLFGWDRLGE